MSACKFRFSYCFWRNKQIDRENYLMEWFWRKNYRLILFNAFKVYRWKLRHIFWTKFLFSSSCKVPSAQKMSVLMKCGNAIYHKKTDLNVAYCEGGAHRVCEWSVFLLIVVDYNNHIPQWRSISEIYVTMCELKVNFSTVMYIHNFAFCFKASPVDIHYPKTCSFLFQWLK